MSEKAPGPWWWKASDGNWYPPTQSPGPGWHRSQTGRWLREGEEEPAKSAEEMGVRRVGGPNSHVYVPNKQLLLVLGATVMATLLSLLALKIDYDWQINEERTPRGNLTESGGRSQGPRAAGLLPGIGMTRAEFDGAHEPWPASTNGEQYGPALGDNRSTYDNVRYDGVVHAYDVYFRKGTPATLMREHVVARELPQDARTISFVDKGTCQVQIVESPAFAELFKGMHIEVRYSDRPAAVGREYPVASVEAKAPGETPSC